MSSQTLLVNGCTGLSLSGSKNDQTDHLCFTALLSKGTGLSNNDYIYRGTIPSLLTILLDYHLSHNTRKKIIYHQAHQDEL